MKIQAEKVRAEELVPGDLFSTVGRAYWDNLDDFGYIGEKVYIRTDVPCPEDQADVVVYRLTIHR